MKIGIEAERANTDHPTGVEHYAQQLLLALAATDSANEYILYLRTQPREWIKKLPKNFSVKVIPFPFMWTQLRISWEMLFHAPDVLFIPASALPLIHPQNSVVTIHDIAWKFYPETFSFAMRWYLKFSTWFAVRFSQTVLTVSKQTRADVLAAYNVSSEKIIAAPLGFDAEAEAKEQVGAIADAEDTQKITELPERFILYLGTLQPRKNIGGLIDAFEILQHEQKTNGTKLVIAGGKGWLYDQIIARIKTNPDIIYFGYVHDRFALMKRAAILVQPAFYEGFGLQLLDAFWAGVPVACSNISSLPEVAGDAAEYFDPQHADSIAAAIDTVINNPERAKELSALGSSRLQNFSWKKTAAETLAAFTLPFEIHKQFHRKFFLVFFAILQFFIALTVSTGMLRSGWAWGQIVIAALGCVFFDEYFALLSTIIALPFWLALPNPKFDALSAWRVAAAFTVLTWIVHSTWKKPIFAKAFWVDAFKRLPLWDRYLFIFAVLGGLTIVVAPFKVEGVKEFLFFASAYSLYFAAVFILYDRKRVSAAIKAFFAASAAIVVLGYVQLIATFFTTTYYFWQYWATVISRSYYGSALSDSLVYSNSWFSFSAGSAPSLRMFSVLPDSHAFALVAILSFVPALALLSEAKSKAGKFWLWCYMVFAALAIDLSGTRGAWAGAVVPVVVGFYYFWKWVSLRLQVQRTLLLFLFLAAFIVLSPLAQKAAASLHKGYNSDDFLHRAESIYDLQESSNAGRLLIWKHTLVYDAYHLVAGTGLGNFVVTIAPGTTDYATAANTNEKTFNLPARYVTAHDLYLDVLTQTGLLGFVPFLCYIGLIVFQLWKYAKLSKNQYLVSELVVIIWVLAYSVFDGTVVNDRVLLFLVFSLAIAANQIRFIQEQSQEEKHA